MRNLWRTREGAVNLHLKARQQLKAFLLRQQRRNLERKGWREQGEPRNRLPSQGSASPRKQFEHQPANPLVRRQLVILGMPEHIDGHLGQGGRMRNSDQRKGIDPASILSSSEERHAVEYRAIVPELGAEVDSRQEL
jgi:hypothetical protein